jgi:hypothetical protein
MASNGDDRQSMVWMGLGTLILVVFVGLIGFAIQGTDFFLYRFFAPKYEEARRKTFEESRAYNEGVAQELRSAQLEYLRASPDQRKAIASIVSHRLAGYDLNRLPSDVYGFAVQMQKEAAQ